MQYITDQLIEQVYEEIATEKIELLLSHALIKAQAKDYVRESQIRLILAPLAERLSTTFSSKQALEQQLSADYTKTPSRLFHLIRIRWWEPDKVIMST